MSLPLVSCALAEPFLTSASLACPLTSVPLEARMPLCKRRLSRLAQTSPSGRVPQDCRLELICPFMILLNMPSAPVLSIPRCKGLGLRCAPTMALASTLVEGRAGPSSWPQNMSPIALLSAQSDLAGISVSLSVNCSKWMPPERELLRACRV